MILQALNRYYEALLQKGKVEAPGWQPVKASFALKLDAQGVLGPIVDLRESVMRGKKEQKIAGVMNLPAPCKRTVGIQANFLCDNASYMLGMDTKDKPERVRSCFEACAQLHRELLSPVDHPVARAICLFFDTWPAQRAARDQQDMRERAALLEGGTLVFLVEGQLEGQFAHNVDAVREAWQRSYDRNDQGEPMQCLVTGKRAPVARLHPSIKGVYGAQSSGASLVSFNARAFESYGHEQERGRNAPVSQAAAFGYGAALNYLTAEGGQNLRLGDTTLVFWAEDAQEESAAFFMCSLAGAGERMSEQDLKAVMGKVAGGQMADWNAIPLHPQNHFYVLGLAPNAGRVSVRFFLQDSLMNFARHILAHHQRMEVIRPAYEAEAFFPIRKLLEETVNPKSREKTPIKKMAGEVLRAILMDTPYPATLYSRIQVRIRADHEITYVRAAIIKAHLLRNTQNNAQNARYKEAAVVKLNENTTYPPYVLGRLFCVLEALQQAANNQNNTTIRSRFFSAASTTPAVAFPTLVRLAQAHLKKLDEGQKVYYDKQITGLLSMLDETYPSRLNIYDQGVFQLGYYHQTQKRYQKKEDKQNG